MEYLRGIHINRIFNKLRNIAQKNIFSLFDLLVNGNLHKGSPAVPEALDESEVFLDVEVVLFRVSIDD